MTFLNDLIDIFTPTIASADVSVPSDLDYICFSVDAEDTVTVTNVFTRQQYLIFQMKLSSQR